MTRYKVESPKLYDCECRVRGRYGTHPKYDCPHCGGTGYTSKLKHKKDWKKDPDLTDGGEGI